MDQNDKPTLSNELSVLDDRYKEQLERLGLLEEKSAFHELEFNKTQNEILVTRLFMKTIAEASKGESKIWAKILDHNPPTKLTGSLTARYYIEAMQNQQEKKSKRKSKET